MWPVWSPDGTRIAFGDVDGLYVVDADGSALRRMISYEDRAFQGMTPAWSPDGERLVVLVARDVDPQPIGLPTNQGLTKQSFTVTTVDLETGEQQELANAGKCLCLGWPSPAVTWSPDGGHIAFARTGSSPGVYLVPSEGGRPDSVYGGRIGTTLAWQPTTD